MPTKKSRPTKALRKLQGTVSLEDWQLDTIDKINEAVSEHILTAVEEAIRAAFDAERTHASMPAIWSNEDGIRDGHEPPGVASRPVSPLAVFITLEELGPTESEQPVMAFDIAELIEEDLEYCRDDGSFAPGLRRIMNALRDLANQIEQALPKD